MSNQNGSWTIDWTKSLQRTYEYWIVDDKTWANSEKFDKVVSASIDWDSTEETLGSASINISGSDVDSFKECYIRIYQIVEQDSVRASFPMGTFLVQAPSISFDGKVKSVTLDGYTSLMELKETSPEYGYTILKTITIGSDSTGDDSTTTEEATEDEEETETETETESEEEEETETETESEEEEEETESESTDDSSKNTAYQPKVMDEAYALTSEHARAPVSGCSSDKLLTGDFVANTDDTWLSFLSDLIALDKKKFDVDETGRILFSPIVNVEGMLPVWTYTDDNSSILLSSIKVDRDLYSVPNTVEVYYTSGGGVQTAVAINDDPDSDTSTVSRGRTILKRITDPSFSGTSVSDEQLQTYAEEQLLSLSELEFTVTYSHGYCPVRVGDCVKLNYSRAGLSNIRAKVTKQSISCDTACTVEETAVFTQKLWNRKANTSNE